MNKRVCIIRSNPVKPDSRVEKEAWTLSEAGYQVHILAWDRESNHKAQDGTITVADRKIPITWLGHKAEYGAGMKSLKPFLEFQLHMHKWLKTNIERFDFVHACDFDTALFSYRITRKKNKRFIYDIFDFLYGEPCNLFQKLIKKLQIYLIDNADATIICTEERMKQISGAKPCNIAVIHNTPFIEQMHNNVEMTLKSHTEKIKIVYVGILADERMLSLIGKSISNRTDVEFHVAGFGYLENMFLELEKTYDNIFYYGRIPYSEALQLENKCDIMLAIYNPKEENCRFAAPNKFYESLMLGKPVIMAKGTGMSFVVADNDLGELIDFSMEGFEAGLNDLLSRKDEWSIMSEKMRVLYDGTYSWKIMSTRLIDLYNNLER